MRFSNLLRFAVPNRAVVTKKVSGTKDSSLTSKSAISVTPFQASRLLDAFTLDPSVGLPVNLNVRVSADLTRESVRGVTQLPHGIGKEVRLAVFCNDEDAEDMIKAGADFAGISALTQMINQSRIEFDRCIATPEIMPKVASLARVLGPLRLMPNQKSGTVVINLKEAIKASKSGAQVEFRAEGQGDMSIQIGTTAFDETKILENMKSLVKDIMNARPRAGSALNANDKSIFTYPPKHYRDKKSTIWDLPKKSQQNAEGGSSKKDFIILSSVSVPGMPPFSIEPTALNPSSTGYFR